MFKQTQVRANAGHGDLTRLFSKVRRAEKMSNRKITSSDIRITVSNGVSSEYCSSRRASLISARPNWSVDWASCWMSVFMAATVSMARSEIRWFDRASNIARTSGINFIAVMNNAISEPRITPSLRPSPKMQAPTLTSASAEGSDTTAHGCGGCGISQN